VVTVSIVSRLLEGHQVILCKEVAHEAGISTHFAFVSNFIPEGLIRMWPTFSFCMPVQSNTTVALKESVAGKAFIQS